ncbi:MAG: hypothetical protein NUV40_02555 [Patescibacteria group bacterium]|nr:hypothetical protein [Patescibacteria group bacterium]
MKIYDKMETLRERYNKEISLEDNELYLTYKDEKGAIEKEKYKLDHIDTDTFKAPLEKDDEFFYNLLFFIKDNNYKKEHKYRFFEAYKDWYYPSENKSDHKKNLHDTSKDKSDHRKLIFYASSILLNENDANEFDQIIFPIKYAIENPFFFYMMEIDREKFINEIIWKDGEKKELHLFIKNRSKQNDVGWKILEFLLTNWYLPRYDLETTGLIINKLKPEKSRLDILITFVKSIKNNWKQIVVIVIFAIFFLFINYKNPPYIPQSYKLPLTYKELVSDNSVYNYKNILSILFVATSYVLIIWHFIKICGNRLKVQLYIPRLLAAIIIGYFPLFVAKDAWVFGMNCPPLVVLVLIPLCLIFSFVYLFYKVNNNVEDRKIALERVLKIFYRGIIYSIISGTIIFDLTCGTNMHDCTPEGYNNIYMGIFGVIDPTILLVFFPLALLIGIFVQIIWEDKPITHSI